MTCPACGHDNRAAARFCDSCGRPLERFLHDEAVQHLVIGGLADVGADPRHNVHQPLALELFERLADRRAAHAEPLGQHGNVRGTLAQRRQADRKRVDAIEQVLTEPFVADEQVERTVGRGDQPEVDRNRLVPAEPFEAPFLEHAQQLGLGNNGQVPDLVEE